MKLEDLLYKLERLDELNMELGFERKDYRLCIELDNITHFIIKNKDDIKLFKKQFIERIVKDILNNKLISVGSQKYQIKYRDYDYSEKYADICIDVME